MRAVAILVACVTIFLSPTKPALAQIQAQLAQAATKSSSSVKDFHGLTVKDGESLGEALKREGFTVDAKTMNQVHTLNPQLGTPDATAPNQFGRDISIYFPASASLAQYAVFSEEIKANRIVFTPAVSESVHAEAYQALQKDLDALDYAKYSPVARAQLEALAVTVNQVHNPANYASKTVRVGDGHLQLVRAGQKAAAEIQTSTAGGADEVRNVQATARVEGLRVYCLPRGFSEAAKGMESKIVENALKYWTFNGYTSTASRPLLVGIPFDLWAGPDYKFAELAAKLVRGSTINWTPFTLPILAPDPTLVEVGGG
jgi:hypothetical protein